ncbi:3-oxoacyl-[acyl-carrier-protein] synthase III C-terminal domain-containing protein [Streptomyces sp. ACA25]|uniref:3-oxoacyl-[acyl-carrier-protein] synthase III C-terminal domain-containing protein n=1 Tax=Streptomyces sp. ACA25 TaxID=3022596 RepID=UPI0023079D65|nr:3-oxoacyl-[acyl-carrier-protein] synthase III C-terminal domain-containing protein [Streptomyces sp. ACA25]MDB1085980.1 3-oxoacyl-[acyl-carrier-protein] synthase III C-terminal domain-containing protein [Streptomyces sp. ACA25]
MTALLEVACHLPGQPVPIEDTAPRTDTGRHEMRIFRRFYGLDAVHRAPGQDLCALHAAAARSLASLRGQEHRVRYVALARTVSTVAPADRLPPEEVCAALGLPHAVAFTVTQHACASGLLAVDAVGRLLTADGDPDALGLVLMGERVFLESLQQVPGSTVMGESTAAVLVTADGARDRLLSYATHTDGRHAEGTPPLPVAPEFFKEHNTLLAGVIREAVQTAGIELTDLALVLPHNVNRTVWRRLATDLGLSRDQIFLDNIPVTAHCFAADPFINHVHARERGLLHPGDLYLMATVGLGSTFSAAVLRH